MQDQAVGFDAEHDVVKGKLKRYPLNDFYRTPNMERLAASGVRFNNFCAMSVCSPPRISIMTGQNAARHRTTNWINPDNANAGPQARRNRTGKALNPAMSRGQDFAPRAFDAAAPSKIGFDINVG
jgi:arylsulfatase A-like enzyme